MPNVYAVSPQVTEVVVVNDTLAPVWGIEPETFDDAAGGLNIVEGRTIDENETNGTVLGKARALEMDFENGEMIGFNAEKGEAEFPRFLEMASGEKDMLAEFGVGINHKMKSIGLHISDEKALGTVHLAIGNNVHLGGKNEASTHIDFNLYNPTVKADNELLMKDGLIMAKKPRR